MSLTAQAEAAFDAIRTKYPESVVSVRSDGVTALFVRGSDTSTAGIDNGMERGTESGIVRGKLSELSRPVNGATITVDGKDVIVMQSRLDPIKAILTIEYLSTKPITGDGGI